MTILGFRKRIWEILEPAKEDDKLSRQVDIFLLILITLNVLAVILETVESLYLKYQNAFAYFELFSVAIFIVEYSDCGLVLKM